MKIVALNFLDIPGGSVASARDSGEASLIPESGRSPESRKWQPPPVFLPGKFHGQKTLAGYSPWCHKESDTTEHSTAELP